MRGTKSKHEKRVRERTRAEDERLRRELEHAAPDQFKRLVKPLFRSSKTEHEGSKTSD